MIADDHALLRRVVREVVEKESDLQIVAEASNGQEAQIQAAQTQPDVVLMDLDMPVCDGFEATERILTCSPHSRVVIFTASKHEQHAFRAIQQGAVGYLTKDIEPDALVRAIRSASRDELCMPRSLAARVIAHLRSLTSNDSLLERQRNDGAALRSSGSGSNGQVLNTQNYLLPLPVEQYHLPQSSQIELHDTNDKRTLTGRERQVLDLMSKGRKNREIAGELDIAESTVHKHVQNIFEKLHARNRTEAIYFTHMKN